MKVDKKRVMEKEKASVKVSAVRRNLVKASAMAPLVATLHPGAALAASSAFQCAGGDFSNKKFTANGNSINGDNAVRRAVPFYERIGDNSGDNKYPKKLYLINGELYEQNGNAHSISETVLAEYYREDTAYVLVLFDVDTNSVLELGLWPMVQLEEDGGSGVAMAQSCWTSIAGYQGGL